MCALAQYYTESFVLMTVIDDVCSPPQFATATTIVQHSRLARILCRKW